MLKESLINTKADVFRMTSAFVCWGAVKRTQPFLRENQSSCNGIFRYHHKICEESQGV